MEIFNNTSAETYTAAQKNDQRSGLAKASELVFYSLLTVPLLIIVTPILSFNLVRSLSLDFMDLLEEIINDDPVYSRRVTPLVSGAYFGDRKSFSTFTYAAVNDFKTLFMLGHYIPMKARAEKYQPPNKTLKSTSLPHKTPSTQIIPQSKEVSDKDLEFLSNYTRSLDGLSTDKDDIKRSLYTLLRKMRPILIRLRINPRKKRKVDAILETQNVIKRILVNYSDISEKAVLASELQNVHDILSGDRKIDLSTQTDRIPYIDQLLTGIAQQVEAYNQKQTQKQKSVKIKSSQPELKVTINRQTQWLLKYYGHCLEDEKGHILPPDKLSPKQLEGKIRNILHQQITQTDASRLPQAFRMITDDIQADEKNKFNRDFLRDIRTIKSFWRPIFRFITGASQNAIWDGASLPAVKALASHITAILEDYRKEKISEYRIDQPGQISAKTAASLKAVVSPEGDQAKSSTQTPRKGILKQDTQFSVKKAEKKGL